VDPADHMMRMKRPSSSKRVDRRDKAVVGAAKLELGDSESDQP
jgi:hypothetical protein